MVITTFSNMRSPRVINTKVNLLSLCALPIFDPRDDWSNYGDDEEEAGNGTNSLCHHINTGKGIGQSKKCHISSMCLCMNVIYSLKYPCNEMSRTCHHLVLLLLLLMLASAANVAFGCPKSR